MDAASFTRKLLNLLKDVRRTLERQHREGLCTLDATAQLLSKLYPRSVPTWSGNSATTLDIADLLVPKRLTQGERVVSPFDFACAFLDPASTVARFGSFKPPLALLVVELEVDGAALVVEDHELPPLGGLSYTDAMRVLLAGALGKQMLADADVVAEYERRKLLVAE